MSTISTLEYQIGGMDCGSCAGTIRTAIERMPGVSEFNVSVARERMKLTLDESKTDRAKIEKVIKSLGFSPSALAGK
ncbi:MULTISPECIES: heavy-metal-associated domain-containing protein [Paracoccaceae]|jgi:Cd2+/Zn2+-exporting ATPase|uniref:heavy-metal-associated domain-containing protein n=1 Tax=Paracoccaceae TaxID=31989 RepID=UPI0015726CDC|nr:MULTISPECIES: heavy metal-associated domain-containing protein [Paracoccaceae]MBJ2153890.1 heavy-metal-associated domain-containing protein [Paracoccus sp. IB05]NTT88472.1 heavy-metal-associated domain-containing protein [Tabrizicola sp. SY72]